MDAEAKPSELRADRLAWVSIAALWLFHAVSNLAWLKIDTRPPFWDSASHAIKAIDLSYWLTAGAPGFALRQWFTSTTYPPLVYWLASPLAILFWPTADVFVGLLTVFAGILIVSTYGTAAHFGGRKAGLLAAFLVSMVPLVYGLERHFLTDVPLLAMVALAIWMLVRSEAFERRGASLLSGLALGLGLLTKWAFVLFGGGPLFVAALAAVASRSRRRLLNLGLALLVALLVAGPWYLANLSSTLDFFGLSSVYAQAEGDPTVGSLDSWLYYARTFVDVQVLLPLALAFVVGLAVWLLKKRARYETGFLLLGGVALPYLASSLFFNKDPRYTMPFLAAVAAITALGLVAIKPRALKIGLISLLALYATFQFLGLTWGLSHRLPAGVLPGQIGLQLGSHSFPIYTESLHLASPPRSEDWPVEAILDDVMDGNAREGETGAANLEVAVLPNVPCFEPNVFKYYIKINGMPITVLMFTGVTESGDAQQQVMGSDYVVTKTGDLGPAWSLQQASDLNTELHDPSGELRQHLEQVGEYPLPDGSVAELYRRIP
jgi:4-amino-4-deoxy-L-arabinose transferase-like glycosyltransferase